MSCQSNKKFLLEKMNPRCVSRLQTCKHPQSPVDEVGCGCKEARRASRGVSDGRVASPGRLFTSDGGIRRQPCGRCGSNPAVPSPGTQTRVPPQCRRPAGAAEKYQQRLFTERCHSVLPGLQVYFATLPCLAAASQRLFISAPENF